MTHKDYEYIAKIFTDSASCYKKTKFDSIFNLMFDTGLLNLSILINSSLFWDNHR
jgi:hypothetical protein